MKEHIKRKINIGFGALDEIGTPEYNKVKENFSIHDNLKFRKESINKINTSVS